jgi:tetratricopeptide (TPR) repeat protein
LNHCGKPIPVLLDRDRAAFAAYQIIALPTLIVLGPDRTVKYKEAGFSHEGISSLTAKLDEIYGHRQASASMPEGSPEAIRRYGLAMQFLKKGLSERAEELLTQLVKDHPEYRPAWVSLGYCRIASGKVEESRECLEKAYALNKNNTDVAAGLAWVWWKKGDSAQSEKWTAMVGGDDPNRSLILEIRKYVSVQ